MDRSVYKSQNPGTDVPGAVPDKEVDLLELALKLWDYRKWILKGTLTAAFFGLVYSLLVPSTYLSSAIISPKETQKAGTTSTLLSQFGSFGGIVASQLGIGSNNLDRLFIISKSRGLAEYAIVTNNLMPDLYPSLWDSAKKAWKDSSEIPLLRHAVDLLRSEYLSVITDVKANILTLGVESPDPDLSAKLVKCYMDALNTRIRQDVIMEADANRLFLEKQLSLTSDPMIREKVINMIAFEMEKSMLVNTQSFDVLEKPVVPEKRERPNRKLIMVITFFGGFVLSVIGVIIFNFANDIRQDLAGRKSGKKTDIT